MERMGQLANQPLNGRQLTAGLIDLLLKFREHAPRAMGIVHRLRARHQDFSRSDRPAPCAVLQHLAEIDEGDDNSLAIHDIEPADPRIDTPVHDLGPHLASRIEGIEISQLEGFELNTQSIEGIFATFAVIEKESGHGHTLLLNSAGAGGYIRGELLPGSHAARAQGLQIG